MKKLLYVPAIALSFTLIAVKASGQQEAGDEQLIELYEAPVPVGGARRPRFPRYAAQRNSEGWVELNFMVSSEGQAYEIYAANHVGDDTFIDAATRALEQTVFTPARIEDQPVDGSSKILYRFVLEGNRDGARRDFVTRYRQFMSTIEDASQSEAADMLSELEAGDTQNNYEYAFLNLARYTNALKYGTPIEQMEHLQAALGESLANPQLESFLQDDALMARRALAQVQFGNSYFGEALDTLELMRLKGDDDGVEMFSDASEQLAQMRNNDVPYEIMGEIDDNGSWSLTLFKSRFYLSDLTGTVEELKLRCQRRYVFFDFDPEVQYTVSNTAGECTLEVIGDAGTNFTLVQQ